MLDRSDDEGVAEGHEEQKCTEVGQRQVDAQRAVQKPAQRLEEREAQSEPEDEGAELREVGHEPPPQPIERRDGEDGEQRQIDEIEMQRRSSIGWRSARPASA